jgi:hypothetical protein
MKKVIKFLLVMGVFASLQFAGAQGTVTYLSNLGHTPDGSNPVGSDSWIAAGFITGANASGYALDSVQLAIAGASGMPSGFSASLYSANTLGGISPGNSLRTLSGPANPSATGTYTYVPTSGTMLFADTAYFIVVTAGTTTADGAYQWDFMNASTYQSTDGWSGSVSWGSSSGAPSSWRGLGTGSQFEYSQFAINATPAPEPGVVGLMAVGGLVVGWRRWKARSVR